MRDSLEPENIRYNIINGKLNKSEATELLVSLIEESDSSKVRAEYIEILEKIAFKIEKVFKILENCLISDKSPFVRNAAAKAIINNFLKSGLNSINWAIINDKSPLVLKTIFDFYKDFEEQSFELLNQKLNIWIEKFAQIIGVVPEEAKFFLDIEAMFAKNNENYEIDPNTYKYFKSITNFRTKEPWLALNNGHVEILNFNYFKWKYIKKSKNYIESILKLNHPDLFLNSLQRLSIGQNNSLKIPKSIGLLRYLKNLNLSRNNIHEIPDSIGSLPFLEKLDLSRNNINVIPDSIGSLSSLKTLNLSHNNIRCISNSIKTIKSLTELKLSNNNIQKIPDSLKPFLNSLKSFKL